MKKLVIFDLDGTLLNTIEDLGEATNHALERMGFPTHPLASYPSMVGNGVMKLLSRAVPAGNSTPECLEELRGYFKEYYDSHCTEHSKPYPGVRSLLQDLQDNNVKMAVASNKYHSAVQFLINHFFPEIKWAAIEGQKEGVPVKPDPSIVFEILNECPTLKQEVLYVGDSGVDIETARRACVDSVGVTWGFRPMSELKAYHADYVVNNAENILEIVMAEK